MLNENEIDRLREKMMKYESEINSFIIEDLGNTDYEVSFRLSVKEDSPSKINDHTPSLVNMRPLNMKIEPSHNLLAFTYNHNPYDHSLISKHTTTL